MISCNHVLTWCFFIWHVLILSIVFNKYGSNFPKKNFEEIFPLHYIMGYKTITQNKGIAQCTVNKQSKSYAAYHIMVLIQRTVLADEFTFFDQPLQSFSFLQLFKKWTDFVDTFLMVIVYPGNLKIEIKVNYNLTLCKY